MSLGATLVAYAKLHKGESDLMRNDKRVPENL